ncbi:MAG: MarR family transcriptional regulator [Rhizobiaceae bacterium]|nr:MarR family transcriptional regulator [Rhizobiaceae bacterium]
MRLVSNHVSHAFARRLESAGVTVAEWVILRELYDVDALAPSRLAERMGMTRGAISKLADRLLAKALIERTADPEDGRAHTLALSVEGLRIVPDLARLADENDASFFGHLSTNERTQIEAILKGIVEKRGLTDIPIG